MSPKIVDCLITASVKQGRSAILASRVQLALRTTDRTAIDRHERNVAIPFEVVARHTACALARTSSRAVMGVLLSRGWNSNEKNRVADRHCSASASAVSSLAELAHSIASRNSTVHAGNDKAMPGTRRSAVMHRTQLCSDAERSHCGLVLIQPLWCTLRELMKPRHLFACQIRRLAPCTTAVNDTVNDMSVQT
jgi:hypothetical protein